MSDSTLLRHLRLPGSFLLDEPGDVAAALGESTGDPPLPQRVFLEDEEATPVLGYPVLLNEQSTALRSALDSYVREESAAELERILGLKPDRRRAEVAWSQYRALLADATTNAVSSSFGRGFPSVFWLYHSIAVSRVFKQLPGEVTRRDLDLGKQHGGAIKYRVFFRYLDQVLSLTYDIVQQAAASTEDKEDEVFPSVLARMRDNVLILTEDHIGPDLRELGAYFDHCLRIDGAALRRGLQDLSAWHTEELEADGELRSLIRGLLGIDQIGNPWHLFVRPQYVTFLTRRAGYDPERFLRPRLVQVWESLLLRLKEFELLADLRRYVIPTEAREQRYKCAAGVIRGIGRRRKAVFLSPSTRPLDFSSPLVVDPVVRRFGLIYDITDFSSIISLLRRSGSTAQDLSFRRIFRFQRRVNRIAGEHKAQLEKYLGDGALFSGRHPRQLLAAAIRVQRYYRRMLEEDFPFNRGMRIALNYGRYRLLPIETGRGAHRYEFFGHGIVELTRLVTGKTTRELDDVRNFLLAQGYSAESVERFFEPVARQSVGAGKGEQDRRFYAYLDHGGGLVNEGIVATEAFVEKIDDLTRNQSAGRLTRGRQSWVVFDLEDDGETLEVAVRRLGRARLKGLGEVAVLELADAADWARVGLEPLAPDRLLALVDEVAAPSGQGVTG